MKICVVIPALNAQKTIYQLITNIKDLIGDIIVIDDGSIDNTFREASRAGATVIRNRRNTGKGAALKKGFKFAIENGFDALITMDADGQHSYEDIPSFLEACDQGADIVLGSRMNDIHNMPLIRIFTNKLTSFIISNLIGSEIEDSQCGFRLIKTYVLKEINLFTTGYEMESELLIKAGRRGFTFKNITIKTIYSQEKSHIKPLRITFDFFKLFWKSFGEKT